MEAEATSRVRMAGFAAAVRARRIAVGLNQETLAELAGVSERTVQALEAAKPTMRIDKMLDVLDALGLSLELHLGAADGVRPGATLPGAGL